MKEFFERIKRPFSATSPIAHWDKLTSMPLQPEQLKGLPITIIYVPVLRKFRRSLKPEMFEEMSRRYGFDMHLFFTWAAEKSQKTREFHRNIVIENNNFHLWTVDPREVDRLILESSNSETPELGISNLGYVVEHLLLYEDFRNNGKLTYNGQEQNDIDAIFGLPLRAGDKIVVVLRDKKMAIRVLEDNSPAIALFQTEGKTRKGGEKEVVSGSFIHIAEKFMNREGWFEKGFRLKEEPYYNREGEVVNYFLHPSILEYKFAIDFINDDAEIPPGVSKIQDVLKSPIVEVTNKIDS